MEPRCIRLVEFNSRSESRKKTQKCATKYYFLFATTILETHHTHLSQSQTVAIHGENMSATPGTTPEHHIRYADAAVEMIEIDLVSLKQS